MGTNAQLERRAVTPRLFDWLETEFPFFPVLRTLEREHMIRCEEYVDGGPYRPGDPGPRGPAAYGSA